MSSQAYYAMSHPAASGEVVTEGHARYCREHGHGVHRLNGVEQPHCSRCGEPRAEFVMSSPQDRRMQAMSDLIAKFSDNEHVVTGERAEIAAAIRELSELGRAERWQVAVSRWADMVDDESNPLGWAVLQGAVFTGYQA